MIWQFIQENWHKILVVILALFNVGKYVYGFFKPAAKTQNIQLPAQGCTITIKPLE